LLEHTIAYMALSDEQVAAEWSKLVAEEPWSMESPDGKITFNIETVTLQTRALAAVVDDGELDADALRSWLPGKDELLHLVEHARWYASTSGAAHPSLLCARLHATKLGAWGEAAAVASGLLALHPQEVEPLARIEAWRLLARCRGEMGDPEGARDALENAARESRTVGYAYTEQKAREEMAKYHTNVA